jgi:purine-binding chemotaxis protein CheW
LEPSPLKRALQLAPIRGTEAKARPEREFFCFKLGELRLGVPSENVREVVRAGLLTPLPKMAPFILGVCGHRGEVLPVLDLLRFLGKGEARVGARTRLFVGISETFVAGVVADSVIGLRKIELADILPAPTGGDSSAEHLLGVVQNEQSGELLSLLNFPKIFQAARARAVAR